MQAQWNATDANDDVTRNNIAHGFLSTKDPSAAPGLEQLLRLFLALMPEELHTFSIARSAATIDLMCLRHQLDLNWFAYAIPSRPPLNFIIRNWHT